MVHPAFSPVPHLTFDRDRLPVRPDRRTVFDRREEGDEDGRDHGPDVEERRHDADLLEHVLWGWRGSADGGE